MACARNLNTQVIGSRLFVHFLFTLLLSEKLNFKISFFANSTMSKCQSNLHKLKTSYRSCIAKLRETSILFSFLSTRDIIQWIKLQGIHTLIVLGVFWIDWKSLLNFFDVLYINWNPKLFVNRYVLHS
jgi:hypothetical protein